MYAAVVDVKGMGGCGSGGPRGDGRMQRRRTLRIEGMGGRDRCKGKTVVPSAEGRAAWAARGGGTRARKRMATAGPRVAAVVGSRSRMRTTVDG